MIKLIQLIIRTLRGEISTKKLIKRGLRVGKNFNRQGHCIIDPPHCWLIEIGDNVTLADGVYVLAHDASTKMLLGYTKIGKVRIGDNVFVGAKSIILPNTTIGNNVIIGAGSIVTKDVPDNSVVVGCPAQKIYDIVQYKNKLEKMKKSKNTFDESYIIGNIDIDRKEKMKRKLEKGIGFIK